MSRLIEIYVEPVYVRGGWSPHDNFLAGTQEFIVETAYCLKELGHEVFVYYNGEPTEKQGIYYLPYESFRGEDVVITVNVQLPDGFKPRKHIYWTNQYHDRAATILGDVIVAISPFHQRLLGPDNRVKIIGHGCYPERLRPEPKEPGLCLFSSSPDRGADFLQSIFARVTKETGATLITTYNSSYSESDLNGLYRRSQFWLHPGLGVELFCISALKSQAAGCIPVFVPNMALADTVVYGVRVPDISSYESHLIEAIKNPPKVPAFKAQTWLEVTKELEKLF